VERALALVWESAPVAVVESRECFGQSPTRGSKKEPAPQAAVLVESVFPDVRES
jgi:hypothetical protein